MAQFLGTPVGDPIVTDGTTPSHYDVLGAGGYMGVADLATRDAIPSGEELHEDKRGAGLRRLGMHVQLDDSTAYSIRIPNYATLTDAQKLAALTSNTCWVPVAAVDQAALEVRLSTSMTYAAFLTQIGAGTLKPAQNILVTARTNSGNPLWVHVLSNSTVDPLVTEITSTGLIKQLWKWDAGFDSLSPVGSDGGGQINGNRLINATVQKSALSVLLQAEISSKVTQLMLQAGMDKVKAEIVNGADTEYNDLAKIEALLKSLQEQINKGGTAGTKVYMKTYAPEVSIGVDGAEWIFINTVTKTASFYVKEEGQWRLLGEPIGGGAVDPDEPVVANLTFPADEPPITASLSGGKTAGTIVNGQVVTLANRKVSAVLAQILVENIFPTYNVAGIGVSQSQPIYGEIGESLSNTIAGAFTQNDAGAMSAMRLYRNGTLIPNGSGTTNPFSVTITMVRARTPSGIYAVCDYAAGPLKNILPANTPDTRSAAVRNPNAPQAAEIGLTSGVIYYYGSYRICFGATTVRPTTSAAVRALPQFAFSHEGNTFTLNTGTTEKVFAIVAPPGRTLASVFDLDSSNANLTASYVPQTVQVKDAGNNNYTDSNDVAAVSTVYVLTNDGTYTTNHRHQFTLA